VETRDWGLIGKLEAARQALEDAGDKGLTTRQVMEAAGIDPMAKGGGSKQTFMLQLTAYCAVYESDSGRRFWLNTDIDDGFHRRIFAQGNLPLGQQRSNYEGEYDE
jgi:hypothetical protein